MVGVGVVGSRGRGGGQGDGWVKRVVGVKG